MTAPDLYASSDLGATGTERRRSRLTVAEAQTRLYWCDSFQRLPTLLDLHSVMADDDWLKLLGGEWSGCDNIGMYRLALRRMLPTAGPVLQMMTPAEIAAHQALPDRLTVYRGCGRSNMNGASWSLDRAVAERFPRLNRYRQADPLLVTGTVLKKNVLALKLDRDEAEIITFNAKRIAVEKLGQEVAA